MNNLEAQHVLIAFLKYFGFFAFEIGSNGSIEVRTSIRFLYSLSLNSFGQVSFLLTHFYFTSEIGDYLNDGNKATKLVMWLEGFTFELSSFTVFYGIFWLRKKQVKLLTLILELEKEIGKLKTSGVDYNKKLQRKSTLNVLSSVFLHVFIMICYIGVVPKDNILIYLPISLLYISFGLYLTLIIQFMKNLVESFGSFFEELDWKLQNLITSCPFHYHDNEVRKIFQIYDKIFEAIPIFNESYGVIVLGIFTYVFGIVTFEIYYGFAMTFDTPVKLQLDEIFGVLGNIIAFMPMLFTFCSFGFSCEIAQDKVKKSFNFCQFINFFFLSIRPKISFCI